MATTRYSVAATANHAEKVYSNLKAARRAADLRAEADREDVTVTTVSTGRVSYTAHGAPAPEPVVAKTATRRAPRKTAKREALGASVVAGWELLYDKPRHSAQVGRRDGEYALICTKHHTVKHLDRLVDERALRREGDWCAQCSH